MEGVVFAAGVVAEPDVEYKRETRCMEISAATVLVMHFSAVIIAYVV